MCFDQPMSIKKKELTQDFIDAVINQHQDMCVNSCLTYIQITKANITWKLDKVPHGFFFQCVVYLWEIGCIKWVIVHL